MESSHNSDATGEASALAASSAVAGVTVAAENSSCPAASAPESNTAGGVLEALSDQVMADSSALKAPGGIADVSNLAPSSDQPSDLNANGSATVSPKPEIRIKLKLSSNRETEGSSGLAEAKTDSNQAEEEVNEEDWLCLKCINNNGAKRTRCWNCKGWKGGKRENFNPNKTKEDADDGGDLMDVDDADQARAVEEPVISLDLRATETASNDAEEDSDDDMPMMSLKSKPIKNKKFKPTPTENSSRASPSTESSAPKPQHAPAEPKKSKKSHPKTKLFSGTLRSAAAAHRNRQMHVPPIGSPGLLMLPNPSTVANFPLEDGTIDKKRKTTVDDVAHLLHNGYILPRTVYEQSMIAGGYTYEKRMDDPHRGSSTERTVDDMFDSDVSLYLHFPELIPLDLWERRLKRPKVEASDDVKAEPTSDQQDLVQANTENGTSPSSAVKKLKSEQPEDLLVEKEKGPRLVDSLIQSLSKLTDDANNRTVSSEPSLDSENSVMPDAALSQPPLSTESSSDVQRTKLPQLNPFRPGTRKRSLPHQPMSFLDMIPISLASTYPPKYVEKRRAYAHAVMEREHLIVESQEATDDATDNAEKYQAHKEAWDRMFEYQKQQIAKREAAAEEADRKAKEEAELKEKGASENDIAESKPGTETSESKPESEFAESNGDSNGVQASETKTEMPKERKREDPMDYMPKPPELPPPERFITVPDIPIPPSPPSVLEIEDKSMKSDEKAQDSLETMHVPKVDQSLIRHLDPTCFLPTAEGRYFGLLSNYIADPLFVGPAAVGIRGITSGGGTGLATSYIGGGRGASGLISGPLRGGINSWQQSRETQLSSTTRPASTSSSKKKGKKEPTAKAKPDEGKDDTKPSPEKSEAGSSTSKKRRASETDGSDGGSSKKKVARVIPLATGDRNTLATEIASGPAGDEFPEGWTVKTYRRAGGETVGKTDRFWFSPGLNIRFRAKKHAMSFIDILEEPECNGDEQIAAETYRARGLHF